VWYHEETDGEKMTETFLFKETCGYAKDCTVRELDVKRAQEALKSKSEFRSTYKGIKEDEDGFWYCGYCRRIGREQLVQCPNCKKFFRGPKPFFPVNYECEKCG
jgi:hypothetical protein